MELKVTSNDRPLDARTYLYSLASGKEADRSSTGANGVARYDVPVGEYRIKIRPRGIAAPERFLDGVMVKMGKVTRETVDFAAGKIEVEVKNGDTKIDARTYLIRSESGKEWDRESTGNNGIAGYNVPIGEYRIRVRPDDIDAKDRFIRHIQVKAGKTSNVSVDFSTTE